MWAKTLSSKYNVDIYTFSPINRETVKRNFNLDINGLTIYENLIDFKKILRIKKGRLVRLKLLIEYSKFFDKFKNRLSEYDLIIDSKSVIPFPADILYIHDPNTTIDFFGEPNGVYDWFVKFIYRRKFNRSIMARKITNSKWSARLMYKFCRIIPDVIYPPVDVKEFSKAYKRFKKRDKIIVTMSRITREKNIEKILYVASNVRDYNFIIIGTKAHDTNTILDKITKIKEKMNINNVEILVDIPRKEVIKIYETAQFYLHPPYPEHFGISIVEAMAAGLVPIVYKNGGAWLDIVSEISPRLGYSKIEEVPSIIKNILPKWQILSQKSHQKSIKFSKEKFSTNILKYIDNIINTIKI